MPILNTRVVRFLSRFPIDYARPLLQMQRRVTRICFQHRKLLTRTFADIGGQSPVILPEICIRAVDHAEQTLKGLRAAGLAIRHGAIDALVDPTSFEVCLKLHVDTLRVVLVKP